MPKIIQKLFPSALYNIPNNEKKIYLTFDDGPIPEVTPWIFDLLKKYSAKATFFWLGNNMLKHPEYIEEALAEGHIIGNHSYDHPSGWKTDFDSYLQNVKKCDDVYQTNLFRPPYGEISIRQYRAIKKFKTIVLWDVVSYDYDINTNPEKCYHNIMDNVSSGSIVVFHDSIKAWPKLMPTLPRVMEELTIQGYTFDSLRQYFSVA